MAEFTQYINKLQAKIVKYSQKAKSSKRLALRINTLAQTSLLTFYATIRIYVIKMSFSPKIQYIQKKMPRIMTCIFPLSVSLLLKAIYQIV